MPEENDQQLPDDADVPEVRKAYNRERERRVALEAEAQRASDLARENAFLKAGVAADTPIGQLFTKGYDGELDVDAIKTAWTAVSPGAAPSPDPTGQPADQTPPPAVDGGLTPEQLERLNRSQGALNNDGVPPGAEPAGPLGREIMDAAFEAQGGTRARPTTGMDDKSLNAGYSVLFGRAAQDDPEAVFKRPGESWGDATERWRRQHS